MQDCIKVIQGLSADFKIGDRFCETCAVACICSICGCLLNCILYPGELFESSARN